MMGVIPLMLLDKFTHDALKVGVMGCGEMQVVLGHQHTGQANVAVH